MLIFDAWFINNYRGFVSEEMSWYNKESVRKGQVGERIVKDILIKEFQMIYEPAKPGPHDFDFYVSKNGTMHVVEAKTKEKMVHYDCVGFDQRHLERYRAHESRYNMPVFIYFVDASLREVYGNWLDALERPFHDKNKQFPWVLNNRGGPIINFHMNNMRRNLGVVSEEDAKLIKSLTNIHKKYEQ